MKTHSIRKPTFLLQQGLLQQGLLQQGLLQQLLSRLRLLQPRLLRPLNGLGICVCALALLVSDLSLAAAYESNYRAQSTQAEFRGATPQRTPAITMRAKQTGASSEAEAARIAQQQHGGKVLSVETVRGESGVSYRVKLLLENGRVKTVVIKGA